MLNTILSVLEVGDAIGTFGCYFYAVAIAGGIVFCMVKYLDPEKK